MSNANLDFATFGCAIMCGIDLRRASLRNAMLNGCDLLGARLDRANLEETSLQGTNLSGATLKRASLQGTSLFDTKFCGADLTGTSFRHASCGQTIFSRVDLSSARHLETVHHLGPSSIDFDTFVLSNGKIPEQFLRDAGIPDPFIVNIHSLVGALEPLKFHSCFISHSTLDRDFADRLHADLRNNGIRCWFAPEDLKIGDRFRQRIDEAIHLHDRLLLILSEHSVGSNWVRDEVEACFERERSENRVVLFPVRIDDAVMDTDQAWAAAIRRQRHIGDFRKWKQHDAYKLSLRRLMTSLKSDVAKR